MKGYKCFDKNLQCRNFQYEVGKTYKHDGEISLCNAGFHFCQKPADVFNYYDFDINNRVCEIEAIGNIINSDDKSVTDKIAIIKELSWNEVLEIVNAGKANSGNRNSGNWNSGNGNSGNRNSGNGNSGDWNSGDWNSGDWNSGNGNSGDWNSGDRNSGNRNSGNGNSGDWNSGDWNSTNRSSGIFCSTQDKLRVFNVQTNITMQKFLNNYKYNEIRDVLYRYKLPLTYWLSFSNMTDEEKKQYKEFECQGGVLLKRDYKTACEIWWKNIPNELKTAFINWEYFDAEVFEEITGIKV